MVLRKHILFFWALRENTLISGFLHCVLKTSKVPDIKFGKDLLSRERVISVFTKALRRTDTRTYGYSYIRTHGRTESCAAEATQIKTSEESYK